jgi:hypothetical protein
MPVHVETSRSYPPQVGVTTARPAAFLETSRDGGHSGGRIPRRSGRIHHFVDIGIGVGITMTSGFACRECRGWPAHLTRPALVKNGPTLRTLDGLRAFPQRTESCARAQRMAMRLRTPIGRDGDIGAVTEKVELALSLELRWLPMRSIEDQCR